MTSGRPALAPTTRPQTTNSNGDHMGDTTVTELEKQVRETSERWKREAQLLEELRQDLENSGSPASRELLLGAIVKLRRCAEELGNLVVPF